MLIWDRHGKNITAYDTVKEKYGEHMNWIILLLLFGCGGFGGSCGCGNDCGCGRMNDCGCRRSNDCGCGNNRRECASARQAVREAKEDAREALRDVREAKEREQAVCDGPGMVPQPWQDYPPMPRRDNDCGKDRDCGCN